MNIDQSYVEINSITQIEQVRNKLDTRMSEWREKLEQNDDDYCQIENKVRMADELRNLFDVAHMGGGVVYLMMSDATVLNSLLTGD